MRTGSDTDGCAGSTSHSEGRNTAIRTGDGTGRKKTTPFLWKGEVLDFRLGKIQEGGKKKMSDSERWTRQVT